MSARHPTPWRAEGQGIHDRLRSEYWSVIDSNGFFVAEGLDEQTAREIVDAVNARDRLAILVGRLADNLERYHIVGERDRDLLREARAALKMKGKRP